MHVKSLFLVQVTIIFCRIVHDFFFRQILTDKLPELLDFSKDLSSLEPALKVSLLEPADDIVNY